MNSIQEFKNKIDADLNHKKKRYERWVELRHENWERREMYKPKFVGYFNKKAICPVCNLVLEKEIVGEDHWVVLILPYVEGNRFWIIYSCRRCGYEYAHVGGTGGDCE